MTITRISLPLFVFISLVGCAFGAETESMIAPGSPLEGGRISGALEDQVGVTTVTGGTDTYMMWTSEISDEAFQGALIESLRTRKLYSADGRFELTAHIEEVDQPLVGFDFDVTTRIHYELRDRETDVVLLDEVVVATGTATTDDSLWGTKRLRLANEKSAKRNLQSLFEALARLDVDTVGIAVTE